MKWPKIFTVPDGPEDMCRGRFDNGLGCRCASGWVRHSIPHDTYPDAFFAFHAELKKRMIAKVSLETRNEAEGYASAGINDNYLTLAQSAEAVQETAAHFGFTENA